MPREISEAVVTAAPRRSLPDGAMMAPNRMLLGQRSESHLTRYQAAVEALKGESLRVAKERAASVEPLVYRVERGAGSSICTTAAGPQSSRSSSVLTAHVVEWQSDNGLSVVTEQESATRRKLTLPQGALEPRSVANSFKNQGHLTVDELSFDGDRFDAGSSPVRQQILSKMGLPDNCTIELMTQQGGLNQGLWLLRACDQNFVLKLVTCQRMHPMMPTEAEQFVKLAREHPALLLDEALSFPVKIFRCRGKNAEAWHDLVVMRQAPGQVFSDVIGRKLQANKTPELLQYIGSLGTFLADVHARHGMEHGDFTPSNVFYDERSDAFTLVDVSDFGPQEWNRRQSDYERFIKGLELVTRSHAPQLFSECRRHFESGYQQRLLRGR